MMSSLSIAVTSCKRCDRVGPGLDLCFDCVVLVRGEADLVAAERDHIDLAVRVVALEGHGVRLGVGVPGGRAPVGCRERGVCEGGCGPGIKAGDRVVLTGLVPHDFCVLVLVDDLCDITLFCLLDRRMGRAGGHV